MLYYIDVLSLSKFGDYVDRIYPIKQWLVYGV